MEILRGDGKLVVNHNDSRHVYVEQSDGNYGWDPEESDARVFPEDWLDNEVADEIDGEVESLFPLTFTVHAAVDKNTRTMCRQAGLPDDDDDLIDLLWYYPGEFSVTYELSLDGGAYSLEALRIEYEGICFTPE